MNTHSSTQLIREVIINLLTSKKKIPGRNPTEEKALKYSIIGKYPRLSGGPRFNFPAAATNFVIIVSRNILLWICRCYSYTTWPQIQFSSKTCVANLVLMDHMITIPNTRVRLPTEHSKPNLVSFGYSITQPCSHILVLSSHINISENLRKINGRVSSSFRDRQRSRRF